MSKLSPGDCHLGKVSQLTAIFNILWVTDNCYNSKRASETDPSSLPTCRKKVFKDNTVSGESFIWEAVSTLSCPKKCKVLMKPQRNTDESPVYCSIKTTFVGANQHAMHSRYFVRKLS